MCLQNSSRGHVADHRIRDVVDKLRALGHQSAVVPVEQLIDIVIDSVRLGPCEYQCVKESRASGHKLSTTRDQREEADLSVLRRWAKQHRFSPK